MANSQPSSVQIIESPHCSKDPEKRARQLANLRPPWQPGETPNPAGRPAAGLAVIEAMNLMGGWSEEQIREVADDDDALAAKRTAACRWLAAIDSGNERDARDAAVFVCNYSVGRPHQSFAVREEQEPKATPAQLVEEFRRIMGVPQNMPIQVYLEESEGPD